jgi:hypothetical protein
METRSVPMAALGTLELVTARAWRRELAEMAWEEEERYSECSLDWGGGGLVGWIIILN